MTDYNTLARIYWVLTAMLGFFALAASFITMASGGTTAMLQVAVGAGAAALAGLFPVRVPGTKAAVAIADVFVFLLLLNIGPAAATIAAATEAAAISLRTSKRWTSWCGSPALAAMAMYVSAQVLEQGRAHMASGSTLAGTCMLLLGVAGAYYVLGTLLVVSLPRIKRGEPVAPAAILVEHYWVGVGYAASASTALLLHATFSSVQWALLTAAGPVLLVFMTILHGYLRQAAARRI